MQKLNKFWFMTLMGTLAISWYPLYMGFRVVYDMVTAGSVADYDFPKYIIPYTPIAIAVITAVAIMPLILKYINRFPTFAGSVCSLGAFFVAEVLFESKVIVTSTVVTTLESWQMFMCYIPPEQFETRQWTAIDVLMGEYSPTFKLHFYLISVVLIIAIINCIYGFAKMIQNEEKTRCKVLAVQTVSTALFLGLCIFACFTAFFRDGEITVSPLSAFLMGLFFVVLGVTVGIYACSFVLGKRPLLALWMPSIAASLVTLAMYIGELFLLSGHLYRFGTGILFDGIAGVVLAPIDLVIIAISGIITYIVCRLLNRDQRLYP